MVTKDMPVVPMTPNSLAYPVNNNDAIAAQQNEANLDDLNLPSPKN